MEVEDVIKGKKPKKYEEYDEVDELDASGVPTGRRVKVYRVPEYAKLLEREDWLEGRLREREADPSVNKVIVPRGRYDDVIGIVITRKVT